ncbi:polyamine ABC transporter substrate-binding protein [Deltaproteobacteria bacterium Smac51]|nr:polyamine ABC transporter substrate-binding protein [Deltaproteobacteria bacterium Smac51]
MKTLAVALAAFLLCFSIAAPMRAADETLTIFIWSEYMDPDLIKDFEKKHDIKVRMDFYESNEEMVAKLQSGGVGQYDLIVPSTYFVTSLKKLDLIRPLDKEAIPNLKNISPEFASLDVDPEGEFIVPYQWGTSGLLVRYKDIESLKPSWDILYNPEAEIGNMILFDTARDVIGSALKHLGYSINSTDLKEVEAAARLIMETKKRKAFFGFDGGVGGMNKVLSGVATVTQVYSGEGLRAQDEDPGVHYLIPEGGCEIWMDLLAIPKNAPNAAAAHKFINYILEPEVGAQLSTYTLFATPNAAAMEFIPEEHRTNPFLYPSAEEIKKMEYMQDLGEANRIYDEAWTMIKTQ